MNFMSTQRERLIPTTPEDTRIIRREIPLTMVKGTSWNRLAAVLRDPELAVIVMFCAIGLLATVALFLAFPGFGEIMQSVQQLF